jgi:prepilin signal peptidase PulO-like enzyme (type II secretory pathway)
MTFAVLVAILGLFIGSFVNATALRYDPERFVFAPVARGRSHCPHCRRDLRWFELVPLLSYIAQGGKCRTCRARLSWQYPLSELATAAAFFAVMWRLYVHPFGFVVATPGLMVLWLIAAATLVLTALIDLRTRIIPDELVLFFVALGAVGAVLTASTIHPGLSGSFLGPYSLIFGFQGSIWLNRLLGALFGGVFFGLLSLITRGRGVGFGDLKLSVALGVLFGWPDITLIVLLSFVLGTLFLLPVLLSGKLRMKGTVAFGPFLVLASFVVLVWGSALMHSYFSLFGLL